MRREIAGLYDHIVPSQILVHTGAEEAIFNFMNDVLQPGDHAIVHWPCYQSLFEVAHSIGCQVSRWVARPEAGWALDLDWLRDNLRPNTRAVVVNCPHNPTGYLMSHPAWRELDRLARQHGFLVFSDEVYRFLEYDAGDRLPAFCDLNERAVSMGVMSKSFGLAGLRIGWIATRNKEVYARMAAFKDYTTICNPAPSEFLAALALRHKEVLWARNRAIIQDNLILLEKFFSCWGDLFGWQPPIAGPVAFPKMVVPGGVDAFCRRLVADSGVLLLPGRVYGDDYDQHVRIGFGRANMAQSIEQLEHFLQHVV